MYISHCKGIHNSSSKGKKMKGWLLSRQPTMATQVGPCTESPFQICNETFIHIFSSISTHGSIYIKYLPRSLAMNKRKDDFHLESHTFIWDATTCHRLLVTNFSMSSSQRTWLNQSSDSHWEHLFPGITYGTNFCISWCLSRRQKPYLFAEII